MIRSRERQVQRAPARQAKAKAGYTILAAKAKMRGPVRGFCHVVVRVRERHGQGGGSDDATNAAEKHQSEIPADSQGVAF